MVENPPAFPNTGNSSWQLPPAEGMNLRDWFAGQALAGLTQRRLTKNEALSLSAEAYAALSYRISDAMLAERSK